MKIVKPGIILAADFGNTSEAIEVLENLKSDLLYVKIGPGLFASGGMGFVREVIESGFRVFLDLKLHDIPNTVSSAVDFFSRSGIWALTLHAAGGSGMLEAASRTNALAGGEMMLLGVTVLTSLDGEEWKKVCPGCIMTEALESRACLCKKSGLDGIVCAPSDLALLVPGFRNDLVMVVPGIRDGFPEDDQKRTASIEEALDNGADYVVVGRPVLRAPSPKEALNELAARLERWKEGNEQRTGRTYT